MAQESKSLCLIKDRYFQVRFTVPRRLVGMKTTFLLLILPLGYLLPVNAGETVKVKDHRYPVQIEAQDSTWMIQGTEHFKYKAIFSVFTAALYTRKEGEGQKLHFTYTRELKADDLRKKAMETLQKQHDEQTLALYTALTEQMQSAYVNVKEGDAYIVTVHPDKGTWLHFNDREVFYTENAAFGKWYMGIWLGDPPVNASLKKALMESTPL